MFFHTRTLQEQLPNSLFVAILAVIGWFLFNLVDMSLEDIPVPFPKRRARGQRAELI